MERMKPLRSKALIAIFLAILCFFAYRLYVLQIYETGGVVDNTTTYSVITTVKAARGEILDRNGNVLVGNRATYSMTINHYVLTGSEDPNNSILSLVELCNQLGVEYTDHFPITRERPFTYTLDQYNSSWQRYFQTFLKERGDLDSDISAPLLIQTLRESYDIPETWTDEQARLVIGIRYELTLRNHTNLPVYVFIEDANDNDLSAILELNVPGLRVEPSTVREYYTPYAAHILGFVGSMNATQWEHYKEIDGYAMDTKVGQDGLEEAFEEYLHGVDGERVDEVTKDGTVIRSYYKREPRAGNNVEITIDINLQAAAEEQLATTMQNLRNSEDPKAAGLNAEGAAAVAVDTRTGEVLACASYPTYDLSSYFTNYNEILNADFKPLFNRALDATYPPGSTYKMSMVVASINNHVIGSTDTIVDKGVFSEYADSGFAPKCLVYSRGGGTHGAINAMEALCVSCNYYFYDLANRMSIKTMDETAKGLGLGELTGVEISEKKGYRANEATRKILHTGDSANWYVADRIMAAIGQSDNQFTPMQLAMYTSTLANRGTRMKATFLKRVVSADYRSLLQKNSPTVLSTMEISDEAYNAYFQGMRMVVTQNTGDLLGTARNVFGPNYPVEICAKTGTAQRDNTKESDNGAFVCFAPASAPQIAIAVYGEKVGSGSAMGEVAKAITDLYFGVDAIGDVVVEENQLS